MIHLKSLVIRFTRKLMEMHTEESEEFRLLILVQMSLACTSYLPLQCFFFTSGLCGLSYLKVLLFRSRAWIGILWTAGQIWRAACFSKVILEPSHPHLLHVVYGGFLATRAELSIRDCMDHRAENIDHLALTEKNLLTSDLGHFFLVPLKRNNSP